MGLLPLHRDVPQWRKNQLAVVSSAVLIDAAFYLVMPALPQFIRELGVASPRQVAAWTGVLMGISPLLAALSGPAWGRIADRHGLRLNALRTSTALCVAYLASSFLTNVHQLFGLRTLLGLAGGFQTLSIALATQLSPRDRTAAVIGSLQISQIATAAFSPFLGGMLTAAIGMRHTFRVSAALCLTSVFLFATLYRDGLPSGSRTVERHPQNRGRMRELLALPDFGILAALLFLNTVIERGLQPLSTLFAVAHTGNPAASAWAAGLILSLAAAADSSAAWFCSRRMRLGFGRPLLLWRWSCGALLCGGLAMANSIPQFLTWRVLLALLAGGTLTVSYTIASHVIPESRRAAAFGFLSSCALLGAGSGPLLAAAMSSYRLGAAFLADGLLYGVLVWLVLARLAARSPAARNVEAAKSALRP
ncbi:MAG: MFS transporter [Bryobacteraceae bacterium]